VFEGEEKKAEFARSAQKVLNNSGVVELHEVPDKKA
jgi:hypothetical protein